MTAASPSAQPVDGLVTWAGEELARRGLVVREAVPVRAQPWAGVVSFGLDGPVGAGPAVVWGKAMSPAVAVEIDLLGVLGRAAPGAVLEPLALDRAAGYLLLPDGGPTVTDADPGEAPALWRRCLERYARLQHAAAPFAGELLAAGAPDLRPAAAAAAVLELAGRDELHEVGAPHGLTADEVARLREVAVPGARSVAAALADAVVPASVQHDDLQPSNALVDGRWLDWGDACVAHPFASLLTALEGSAGRPGGPSHVPAMRAAYLGVWAELTGEPLERLSREADLAVLLAPVGRVLAWLRAGPAALEAYPGQVARWLRRLADAPWPAP